MPGREAASDRMVRNASLKRWQQSLNSEEHPCQDLGGQGKERGRKFQAGRTCAKVLRQEQTWLTQATARRGGEDEVEGLLPEKLLPTITQLKLC